MLSQSVSTPLRVRITSYKGRHMNAIPDGPFEVLIFAKSLSLIPHMHRHTRTPLCMSAHACVCVRLFMCVVYSSHFYKVHEGMHKLMLLSRSSMSSLNIDNFLENPHCAILCKSHIWLP